jgi:hypothetical protein
MGERVLHYCLNGHGPFRQSDLKAGDIKGMVFHCPQCRGVLYGGFVP